MTSKPTRTLSKSRLRSAWVDSRDSTGNAGRPGIDNVTGAAFAANLDYNLDVLATRLRKGHYGPSQLKAVFIPKPNSDKERMICIPTISDRLVQRAIAAYLQRTKKFPIYNSSSFGFLPELGTQAAIDAAVRYRDSFDWCLKTDIESFFDSIPRQYLKSRVERALHRHSLTPIIAKIIDCEVQITRQNRTKIQRQGIHRGAGIRQGMPLSPILANLVLAEFDRRIEKRRLKMVRYADDMAIFVSTKKEAQEAHQFVTTALSELKLTIPGLGDASKTQILGPDDPVDFLGREVLRVGDDRRAVWRVSQKQIAKISRKLEDEYNLQTRLKEDSTLQETMVEVWSSIASYFSIYKGAYNFVSLDSALRGTSRKIISNILLDIFGEHALSRITPDQAKFLGLKLLEFDEANSSIMT